MRLVQTRNKRLVFGILFSALIVGIMLTIGQVPLAVSQPVTIPVKAIKGVIPMDGANPIWEGVPGVIIPLSGQTITTPMHPNISVKSVFVKAVSNGKDLGLRLDWSDQTKNDTAIGPQDFRDQAAVMFPVNTAGAPPFQCMGQSGGTVNIWRWNAEWQKDLGKDSAGMWDVDDQYPGIFWDYYFEEPAGGVTYPDRIGRSLGPFNSGIWSGNIMSDPTLRVSSVEDLNANGFSTFDHPGPSGCDRQWCVGAVRVPQGRWIHRSDVACRREALVGDQRRQRHPVQGGRFCANRVCGVGRFQH
jgi:hypothetical protein